MTPEQVAINATGVAPRPRTGWRIPVVLVVTSFGLLIAAVASFVVVEVSQIDGYRWSDDVRVPLDGQSHPIAVDADRAAFIWRFGSMSNPNCVVADAATQTEFPVTWTDRSYVRDGGKSGIEYVALLRFTPTSDLVDVTCPGLEGERTTVAVEPAPRLPPVLAAYGSAVVIPLGLAIAAIVTLMAAVLVAINATGVAPHPRTG